MSSVRHTKTTKLQTSDEKIDDMIKDAIKQQDIMPKYTWIAWIVFANRNFLYFSLSRSHSHETHWKPIKKQKLKKL